MVRPLRSRFSHYGVLAVGLLLTAVMVVGFELVGRARDRARFDGAVQAVQERIRNRIDTSIALLVAARSFVYSTPALDRQKFHDYVRMLDIEDHYPGILGIGYAVRTLPHELSLRAASARELGHPRFTIWPEGKRAEYFPILFLEPLDIRNRAAIGYDMFAEPVRRAAMARARDTNRPAASGKVTLVQEIDERKQAGFLIYVPVYHSAGELDAANVAARRDEVTGFVYSPFRAGDFLRGVFARAQRPDVAFEVYAGTPAPHTLMHRSEPADKRPLAPRFTSFERMNVAGAIWHIVFQSTPAFERSSNRSLAWITGLLGALLSAVLFFVTRSEVRARHAAETAQVALAAERTRLREVLMQTPAAIAIVRAADLRYELSNAINAELSAGRALVGKTVREALPELEAQGLTRLVEDVIATGKPYVATEYPVRVVQADGSERLLYLNGIYQPIRGRDGAVDSVMAFAYDVTDLVVSRQRAEALAEELKTAVRARDDFLSIAGHELRTPLTALTLQIQNLERMLHKHAARADPSAIATRLHKASAHVARLDRLIAELLDVSRISSGRLQLELEDVRLDALVHDVAERFGDELSRAGCALSLQLEPVAGRFDRLRVDQVITNLLGNAVKYGPGKPIEIALAAADGRARLRVRDQGIGIAAGDRERVFQRFERAVSERNYGGLGLGLWIAHQIVQAHHGTIALDSEPGRGSTFTVELPLQPPQAAG